MEVETTDFSIEKIISDIDNDLSFNDVTGGAQEIGSVVYKKLTNENSDPVMIMQIQATSESDLDDDPPTQNKAAVKNDECHTPNGSILGEKEKKVSQKKGDVDAESQNKISVNKDDDEDEDDVISKKSGKREAMESAEQGEGSYGEKKKNVRVDDDKVVDNTINRSAEDVCDYEVTTNDISDDENVTETEPVKKSTVSETHLQDLSVVIEKLDYDHVAKIGVVLGAPGNEELADLDENLKCKKNPMKKKKLRKRNSKREKIKEKISSSKSDDKIESKQKKRGRRCIICFLFVDGNDYDKHIAAHKADMISDNSKSTMRTYPQRKSESLKKSSKQSRMQNDIDSDCSISGKKLRISGKDSKCEILANTNTENTSKNVDNPGGKNSKKTKSNVKSISFSCDECKKDFTSSRDLRHHKTTHRDNDEKQVDKKHRCSICEKAFSKKDMVSRHMKMVHKQEAVRTTASRKRKSETPEVEILEKKGKNGAKSSVQNTPISQPFPGQWSDPPPSEPLVILPFLNAAASKNTAAGSNCGSRGDVLSSSQFPAHVDLCSLGKPKEVRREIVRKYRKSGPFGDEEITETITEIW